MERLAWVLATAPVMAVSIVGAMELMLRTRGRPEARLPDRASLFLLFWTALTGFGLVLVLIPTSGVAAIGCLSVAANGVLMLLRGRVLERQGRVDPIGKFRAAVAILHLLGAVGIAWLVVGS